MKRLVVLVHGWRLTNRDLEPLATVLRQEAEMRDGKIFNFTYPAGTRSNERLREVARRLEEELTEHCEAVPFDHVSIVGHSIGGLIARRCFLFAVTNNRSWSKKLHRIVLTVRFGYP